MLSNFLKALKENMSLVLLVLVGVFVFVFLQQCDARRRLKEDLEFERRKSDQNLAAMNEQIKVIKNLSGEIEASKATYVGSIEEIKKYNAELAARFESQKNLLAGIYSKVSIVLDSIVSIGDKPYQYNDSTYGIKFTTIYDKDEIFNRIEGETKFTIIGGKPNALNTSIYSNEMRIGITYGFRDLGDRYEVFALSKSGKVKFDELEGVLTLSKGASAPQKKLRWGIGPQFGVTYGVGQGKFMPYVGLGLSYNVVRF
jgi:hypothetical protein